MNRKEVIKFLLEELKKVPNREVCLVATEEQIERIAEELEFDGVGGFLNTKKSLNLTVAEVPKDLHFEVVLYFILMTEFSEYFPEDSEIWNLDDGDTLKFIDDVKAIPGFDPIESISLAWVEDVLEHIEQMDF